MAAELVTDYVLYVDGKATSGHRSLQEAKEAANPYRDDHKLLLTIECGLPSAAPKGIWHYDHELHGWCR